MDFTGWSMTYSSTPAANWLVMMLLIVTELCVGTNPPVRYMWSSVPSRRHRIGTVTCVFSTRVTYSRPCVVLTRDGRRPLLRGRRNTGRTVVKWMRQRCETYRLDPSGCVMYASPSRMDALTPRERTSSSASSARRRFVRHSSHVPCGLTLPSVSMIPWSRLSRCASEARRYPPGMRLPPSRSMRRNAADMVSPSGMS